MSAQTNMPKWVRLPGRIERIVNTARVQSVQFRPNWKHPAETETTITVVDAGMLHFCGEDAYAVWAWFMDHVDAAIDAGEQIAVPQQVTI